MWIIIQAWKICNLTIFENYLYIENRFLLILILPWQRFVQKKEKGQTWWVYNC